MVACLVLVDNVQVLSREQEVFLCSVRGRSRLRLQRKLASPKFVLQALPLHTAVESGSRLLGGDDSYSGVGPPR